MTSIASIGSASRQSLPNQAGFSSKVSRVTSAAVEVLQAIGSYLVASVVWGRNCGVGLLHTFHLAWIFDRSIQGEKKIAILAVPIAQRRDVIDCAKVLLGPTFFVGRPGNRDEEALGIKAVAQLPVSERKEIVHLARTLRVASSPFYFSQISEVIQTLREINPTEREEVVALAEQFACRQMVWSHSYSLMYGPAVASASTRNLQNVVQILNKFSPTFRRDISHRQFPAWVSPAMDDSGDRFWIFAAIVQIFNLENEELQGEVIRNALALVDFRENGRKQKRGDGLKIFHIIDALARKPREAESIVECAKKIFINPEKMDLAERESIVVEIADMPVDEREEIIGYGQQTFVPEASYRDKTRILYQIKEIPYTARKTVMAEALLEIRSMSPEINETHALYWLTIYDIIRRCWRAAKPSFVLKTAIPLDYQQPL